MRTRPIALSLLFAAIPAAAQDPAVEETEWQKNARFYAGVRTGLGIPPGAQGLVPSVGIELGVSQPTGLGFGIQVMALNTPPAVAMFNVSKAAWGIGALADARFYFEAVDPLTLYLSLTGGFLAGPEQTTRVNVVLPVVSPGLGARVKLTDTLVTSFEFGFGAFIAPFVTMAFTWEPPRKRKVRAPALALPPPPPNIFAPAES
jgi:hypothetical protein